MRRKKTAPPPAAPKAAALKKPKFSDEAATEMWDLCLRSGSFVEADLPLLVLTCHAWSSYRAAYARLEEQPENNRASTDAARWADKSYKYLVALGMTPCQRMKMALPPMSEGLGVERRGMDGDEGASDE